MRPQRKSSVSFLIPILAVAFSSLSCGGGARQDAVTGVGPDMAAGTESGTFVASKKKEKVLICHEGKNKEVPPSALPEHLSHGDTEGSCPTPDQPSCPCFTEQSILADAAAFPCNVDTLRGVCTPGDSVSSLITTCTETNVIATYFAQDDGGTYSCGVLGDEPQIGLTQADFEACLAAITEFPFCTS